MVEIVKEILAVTGFLLLVLLFVLFDRGCTASAQPYLPVDSFVQVQHHIKFKACSSEICEVAERANLGSGFVAHTMKGNSWIFTAGHVCLPPPGTLESRIAVVSGGQTYVQVELVHIAEAVDLCVLLLMGKELPQVTLSPTAPKHGDQAYALAAPFGIYEEGLIPQFSGYYSGVATNVPEPANVSTRLPKLDTYTIPSRPGSSGGPIFNSKRELVGMIVMAHPAFETFTLASPYPALRLAIDVITGRYKGQ